MKRRAHAVADRQTASTKVAGLWLFIVGLTLAHPAFGQDGVLIGTQDRILRVDSGVASIFAEGSAHVIRVTNDNIVVVLGGGSLKMIDSLTGAEVPIACCPNATTSFDVVDGTIFAIHDNNPIFGRRETILYAYDLERLQTRVVTTQLSLSNPFRDVLASSVGTVYVLEEGRIWIVDGETGEIEVAGVPRICDGTGLCASWGMALHPSGDLFVTDFTERQIQRLDVETWEVKRSYSVGPVTDIAVAADGTVYFLAPSVGPSLSALAHLDSDSGVRTSVFRSTQDLRGIAIVVPEPSATSGQIMSILILSLFFVGNRSRERTVRRASPQTI